MSRCKNWIKNKEKMIGKRDKTGMMIERIRDRRIEILIASKKIRRELIGK